MAAYFDYPYRILITGDSRSGKTNTLLNLTNQEPDIDKIYLYVKNSYEAKYQILINKRESTGIKYLNDCKTFNEHSNDRMIIDKILKNIIQIRNKKY